MHPCQVILSGFADEASLRKTAVEQFSTCAALGLQYFTIRFVDVGNGIKNVMDLSDAEIHTLSRLQTEYHLQVASVGSPIGKVKLHDVEDGTDNRYVPFEAYLDDVKRAIHRANQFDTHLVRGFSFYPPRDAPPEAHLADAIQRLGRIADLCQAAGVIFGLEVEANLVGRTGQLLAEIHAQINSPSLKLVFDAANLLSQGFSAADTIAEYQAMKPGLGWIHVKDYVPRSVTQKVDYVDEESLCQYVPVGRGSGVYDFVLRDLRCDLPRLEAEMQLARVPGFVLDLEPHLKGGGQFGGVSGPDGMGVALRSLCGLLDELSIGYDLTS